MGLFHTNQKIQGEVLLPQLSLEDLIQDALQHLLTFLKAELHLKRNCLDKPEQEPLIEGAGYFSPIVKPLQISPLRQNKCQINSILIKSMFQFYQKPQCQLR